MSVDTLSLFSQVIQDHLRLKEQNSTLEPAMPLRRYKSEDPFENHPLFKTEEQARLEETLNGEETLPELVGPVGSWPVVEEEEPAAATVDAEDSGLWTRSRDFDWGD
jgi:hypothetical protein